MTMTALAIIGMLVAALQALGIYILAGMRKSIHDLRNDVQRLSNKVAVLEDRSLRHRHTD